MTDEQSLPRRTFLVQRLHKPYKKTGGPLDSLGSAFSSPGLSKALSSTIEQAFALDYMGAAEFEYGTIPKVLKGLVEDQSQLRSSSFVLQRSDIKLSYGRKYPRKGDELPPPPTEPVRVYMLARESQVAEAREVITRIAKGELDLKERAGFCEALDPVYDSDQKIVGWFELNNGFFWFTDKEMWILTCGLFGLPANEAT